MKKYLVSARAWTVVMFFREYMIRAIGSIQKFVGATDSIFSILYMLIYAILLN